MGFRPRFFLSLPSFPITKPGGSGALTVGLEMGLRGLGLRRLLSGILEQEGLGLCFVPGAESEGMGWIGVGNCISGRLAGLMGSG